MFKLRLRDVILINLMPASVLALGLPLLIWLSGGTDNILVYPIVLLCIMATSAFFSIHYLTCYYLLQPYNEATETKSSTYGVVMGITYLVCFAFIYLRMDPIVFGGVMIIFSVLYAVIARILVYRLAPSTFRCAAETAHRIPRGQAGAAANTFQKNAIGKFFSTVPIQMTGRSMNDRWARMTLNRMEAVRLIAGHMNATVPACRISCRK